MKRALIFLLFLTLLNSARAEFCPSPAFDTLDITLASSAALMEYRDYRQTLTIAENPTRWREYNDLGQEPCAASSRKVACTDELCGNGSEVGAGDTAKG